MWTEIKTRPRLGVDVLVFSPSLDIIAIASLEKRGDELYWESDSDELAASAVAEVTHWMLLPAPPASVD